MISQLAAAALIVSLVAVAVAVVTATLERRSRIAELSLMREQMTKERSASLSITQGDIYRQYGFCVWEFTIANTGASAAEDVELVLLTASRDDFTLVPARPDGPLLPGERVQLRQETMYDNIRWRTPSIASVTWRDGDGKHSAEKRLHPTLPDFSEAERRDPEIGRTDG